MESEKKFDLTNRSNVEDASKYVDLSDQEIAFIQDHLDGITRKNYSSYLNAPNAQKNDELERHSASSGLASIFRQWARDQRYKMKPPLLKEDITEILKKMESHDSAN